MQDLPENIIPKEWDRYDFETEYIDKFKLLFASNKNEKFRNVIYYGIAFENGDKYERIVTTAQAKDVIMIYQIYVRAEYVIE